MANVKITELTNLTDPSTTDVMPVVDVDADVTKKVSVGEVVGKITGDVEVATDGTATISELPVSKLQDGAARQLLQTDAAGTGVEWTDDVDLPGTLDVTGVTTLDDVLNVAGLASLDGGIDVDGVFTVADATGNVSTSGTFSVTGQSTLASAAISDLTEDRVVIAGASGELEDSANLTFDGSELGITGTLNVSSNGTISGDLTVVGDLTVEGATTTLETQTVTVEDKNIEMGVVDTPSDTTADGGGITLKGATDKTINWVNATDAWTFSEHIELASGKEFYIDGNGVLNATTLGSGVVNSSLTSVGTIATGTWEGTAIDAAYLDPTVVTTDDTGTVTSAMIENGTIVDEDIGASAAIAGTKIDPDFGSQNVTTTGTSTAASFSPTSSTVPTNGVYLPAANQLALATSGTGRLFVSSSGDVGIGTSSPGREFEIYKDGAQTAIGITSSTTGESSIYFADTADSNPGGIVYLHSNDSLGFRVDEAVRATIDSSGRFLVGTSSARTSGITPIFQTEGTGSVSNSAIGIFHNRDDNSSGPRFVFTRTRGAAAGSSTIVQSDDSLGQIVWHGADGTDTNSIGARVECYVDGTPGANDMPGRLEFSTTADGSASPTERMRITNDGRLLVSTTTSTIGTSSFGTRIGGSGAPGYIISSRDVDGTADAAQFGGNSGVFKVKGDGDAENTNNSYTGVSDIKLKENIVDAGSQWDDLKALQVRKYNFKVETGYNTHTQIGLVAQEVELVSPGLVGESIDEETGETTKSVNYSVLYMKAVKALQEAMERIEQLEAKVAALEAS